MLTITDFIKILQKYYKQRGVSSSLTRFLRATAATAVAHPAVARLSYRNSVCLSICLSIHPSHGCEKQCKLGLPNLHRRLPGRL